MTIGTSSGDVFDTAMDMHAASFASSSAGAIKGGEDTPDPVKEAEAAREAAAARTKQSVAPEGGRKEGAITDFLNERGEALTNQITNTVTQPFTDPRGFAMNMATGGELGVAGDFIPKGFTMSELGAARVRRSVANDNKASGMIPNEVSDDELKYSQALFSQKGTPEADWQRDYAKHQSDLMQDVGVGHNYFSRDQLPKGSVILPHSLWADSPEGFNGERANPYLAALNVSKDGNIPMVMQIGEGPNEKFLVFKNGKQVNPTTNVPAELRQGKDDTVTAEIGEVGFANKKSTSKFSPASAELTNSANTFLENGGTEIELLRQYGLHRGADGNWVQGPPGKLPTSTTRDRPSLYREGRDYYLSRMETGFTGRLGQGEAKNIATNLTPAQLEKIRSMYTNGSTRREVAKELNIPFNVLDYVRQWHGIYPKKPE